MRAIRKTVMEILQSTVFLTTHAYGFSTVVCALRYVLLETKFNLDFAFMLMLFNFN